MTDQSLIDAIAASNEGNPVLLSLHQWYNGIGEPPPPQEMIVSVHRVYDATTPIPPVVTPPVTFWAGDMAKNVRKTPAGEITGQLAQGQSVNVDMTTLTPIKGADGITHKWG